MLPQRFGSFKSLFHPFDRSSTSSRVGSQEYSIPDAVRALREISCRDELHQDGSSSEELQLDIGKESHVDSEDSGLFKEGYFLGGRAGGSPSRLKRSQVNREVNTWKEIASKKLEELTSEYNKGCSKKKVSFSLPLGIETNRKLVVEESDDTSTLFSKGDADKRDMDDDLDLRRNEEFMREVHRVLKSRKNPETLSKRSLSEEYDRQFSKKMSAASEWARRVLTPATDQKALEDKENPAAVGTSDTGAGGDNTSGPVKVILDELSRMMVKNKIWKNSKAATTRNDILRRAEEKRGKVMGEDKLSEIEDENERKAKVDNVVPVTGTEQDNAVNIMKSHVEAGSHSFQDKLTSIRSNFGLQKSQDARIEKVANYLERSPGPCWSECSEGSSIDDDLSIEQENYLFDSLAGEFLKSSRKQTANRGKISKNDEKLLKFLVKRYLKRCELHRIDEILNSNLDDPNLEVPPYENATDREEFFMKKLIGKYIKRGMRTDLEDKIAWIYYKHEAVKNKSEQSVAIQEKASVDKEIKILVEAFKSSGKNSSLNRTVMELVREQKRQNPNLSHQEILSTRETISNMVVERFARMYLMERRSGARNTQEIESPTVGTSVPNRGLEKFNMNGNSFDVLWKFSGPEENASDGDDEFEIARNSPQLKEQPKQAITSRKVDKVPAVKSLESGSRLKDKFWCEQQQRVRRSPWKPKIPCTPIAKRALSLIGGPKALSMKTDGKAKVDKGCSLEDIRRRMREDNVKWLLEQKAKLWEARKREAKRLDKFTMALPKKMEHFVERRNRFQQELDEGNCPPKRTARVQSKR